MNESYRQEYRIKVYQLPCIVTYTNIEGKYSNLPATLSLTDTDVTPSATAVTTPAKSQPKEAPTGEV